MPLEKAAAIILRVVPWSESSYVVTLFTREAGKVCAVAKGGRRLKGPFESALDVLAVCDVVFLRKSSGALDVLTEAKLVRRFRLRGRDLAGLYAGYYVAELLNELTEDYDRHAELFDAADQTLACLGNEAEVAKRLFRFELTALRLLGFLPSLRQCAECGMNLENELENAGRVAFSQLCGGTLCRKCRPGKRHVISLSRRAWQALVATGATDSEAWRQVKFDRSTIQELRSVLNQYMSGLIGHKLRLMDYLTI